MELTDIIKKSALELSIDSDKDDIIKQKNVEKRLDVIKFIDVLIDRELFLTEQVIATAYLEEFGDDDEEEDIDESSFEDNIEEVEGHLSIVKTLAKARAYLKARHEGITGL
jgi:hypothetical protein